MGKKETKSYYTRIQVYARIPSEQPVYFNTTYKHTKYLEKRDRQTDRDTHTHRDRPRGGRVGGGGRERTRKLYFTRIVV